LFGPARDQDPRPTCMAFAGSDAHAAARNAWTPLSVEWAYYHALKRDGGRPHQGATMTGMLDALRLDGQPEETAWPYIPRLFSNSEDWTPPNDPPPTLFHRDSQFSHATVKDILDCLNCGAPVLLTMSISRSFFRPNSEGVVDAAERLEPKRIHAVVATGYGRHNSTTFVLIRNSWGVDWGLAGYAWVSANYLEPRLRRTATMITEKDHVPGHRTSTN
jgi:hypothetical protein